MQELERVPDGRTILRRFMVRGHWRRAALQWTDQRMRWIQPYWKGPDMATIIERAYKLATLTTISADVFTKVASNADRRPAGLRCRALVSRQSS